MLSISVKEYEYLRNDVQEIRRSINRYIGYIISVAGISGVLIKYLYTTTGGANSGTHVNPISVLISLIALIVITFLFEILFYKFKSHNRYCGYMQLLSQEIFSKEMDVQNLPDHSLNIKKDYLKQELKSQYVPEGIDNLITWEFVMARYNNVGYEGSIKNILKSTDKIKFKFSFPRDIDLNEVDIEHLDTAFFRDIIIDLYSFNKKKNKKSESDSIIENNWTNERKRSVFVQTMVEFWFGFSVLFTLRDEKTSKRVAKIIGASVDSKYLSFGWMYPKKLLQIGFLSFICFSFVLFYGFISCYSFTHWAETEFLPIVILITWTLIALRWMLTFFGSIGHLIAGKYSVDYYCWMFFIFRVQLLNKNNIFPEYYCRGFTRFFKSHLILEYCEAQVKIGDDQDEKRVFSNYLEHLRNGTKFDEACLVMHWRYKNDAYRMYKKNRNKIHN